MKPLPWSPSSLADFVNCPKQFYEKRIAKSVKQEDTEQIKWGNYVHKAFENRHKDGTPLPPELDQHEVVMLQLTVMPGQHYVEQKTALNVRMQPCGFFDNDVWMRSIIDYHKIRDDKALIVDYKTGKQHSKFDQLQVNALWLWAARPEVNTIKVAYYWTQDATMTAQIYRRSDVEKLWSGFLPSLTQYREAFKTDTWQPRPSGLCHGWCPVTTCEYWKPKRQRR